MTSFPCKTTPSKSVPPISQATRAIIKRVTGIDYEKAEDLPSDLSLSMCEDLVDVSDLGGVECLVLTGCTGVVDVSALGTVQHLDLRGCTGITDFSAVPRARR